MGIVSAYSQLLDQSQRTCRKFHSVGTFEIVGQRWASASVRQHDVQPSAAVTPSSRFLIHIAATQCLQLSYHVGAERCRRDQCRAIPITSFSACRYDIFEATMPFTTFEAWKDLRPGNDPLTSSHTSTPEELAFHQGPFTMLCE